MDSRQVVSEMCDKKYRDPEVAATTLKSAEEAGTLDKIADGELVLPHPVDAMHYHRRVNNISEPTATETAQALTIKQLMERMRVMEERQSAPQPPPQGV